MRKVTQSRLSTLIYCLVVMNMLLTPVAHASMIMLSGTNDQIIHMGHAGDVATAAEVATEHQHDSHSITDDMTMNCEHGIACQILCSISLSLISPGSSRTNDFDKSHSWAVADSTSLKSACLSRLERPPKA